MRRLKHIIKSFRFIETERRNVELGPNVRLNPKLDRLELKADLEGKFSTTADLFAKHRVTNPQSLKRWVGFQVDLTNKKNIKNVVVTDVRYRLGDGTQELYYNVGTTTWVPAAPNNWNTEQEVADNIQKFPIPASKSLQVIVNLKTSDPDFSPEVREIRLLWESDLEEMDDYIWKSLIPDLRSKIRPIADHAVKEAAPTTTIDLSKLETDYNIISIDAVYDTTADPGRLTDLFDSYDPATKIITLTAVIPANNISLSRFLYEPEVAVTTSQDYIETTSVPQITITSLSKEEYTRVTSKEDVINKGTGAGKQVDATQSDIVMTLEWLTNKAKDYARLTNELRRYLNNNELLRSVGQDELYRLWSVNDFQDQTLPSQQELHAGRLSIRIVKALFYDSDAVDVTGVLNFGLTTMRQVNTC